MKRNRQHEIGGQAEAIFRIIVPRAWVVRRQDPDYGIDFLVEIAEQENMTGGEFAAQVKGTEDLQIRDGMVFLEISVEHLAYYVDKRLQPVYLIVVDVKKKQAYYLFLQSYALHTLKNTAWRDKKNITVQIPQKQLLRDADRFLADFRVALKYMTNLHPGSIEAAVASHKQRLESLDSRFEVGVSLGPDGNLHFALSAKQPFEGAIRIQGPASDIEKKAYQLFGQGVPVTFEPGQLDFEGSALLRHIFSGASTVQLAFRQKGILSVAVLDKSDREIKAIRGMRCELEGGIDERRLSAQLDGCPLEFCFKFKRLRDAAISRIPFDWNFRFNYLVWMGKSILDIGYLEEVTALAQAFMGKGQVRFYISGLGPKRIILPVQFDHIPQDVIEMDAMMALLTKAREVALKLDVAPLLEPKQGEREFKDVDLLHRLVTEGKASLPTGRKELSFNIPSKNVPPFVAAVRASPGPQPLLLQSPSNKFNLLGLPVDVGPCKISTTEALLSSKLEDLEQMAKRPGVESVRVVMAATEKAELIMERLGDKPRDAVG